MRSRFSLDQAGELLELASEINIKILRSGGRNIGIAFELSGELLCPVEVDIDEHVDRPPDDEDRTERARRLVAFLLADRKGGGA